MGLSFMLLELEEAFLVLGATPQSPSLGNASVTGCLKGQHLALLILEVSLGTLLSVGAGKALEALSGVGRKHQSSVVRMTPLPTQERHALWAVFTPC